MLTKEAFQKELRQWVGAVQAQFAGATLPLDEPVLVRWKQLLGELKARNRTIACEVGNASMDTPDRRTGTCHPPIGTFRRHGFGQ